MESAGNSEASGSERIPESISPSRNLYDIWWVIELCFSWFFFHFCLTENVTFLETFPWNEFSS